MKTKLSAKSLRAIHLYGADACRKAFQMNEAGEGANTIANTIPFATIRTTQQADAAINAGREMAKAEAPAPTTPDARLRAGTATGSLVNHVASGYRDAVPSVGAGATILHWTDRTAVTIIAVKAHKKTGRPVEVLVQHDTAIRTDKNGMSDCQQYRYEPNPDGSTESFTLRRNGAWVREGSPMKNGTRLKIGARNHFHDYSF